MLRTHSLPLLALSSLLLAACGTDADAAASAGGAAPAAEAAPAGPPGTPDARYGRGGTAAVEMGTGARVFGFALQPDGAVVVAGSVVRSGDLRTFAAARLDAAGRADARFGERGVARLPLGEASHEAMAVAVQPDGKVVLAGFLNRGAHPEFAVARLLPDGRPDAAFGEGGRTVTGFRYDVVPAAVAVDGGGRIVVAGTASDWDGQYFALARYGTDGALDTGYGREGKVTTTYTGPAWGMALLPDGRAVVAGSSVVATGISMGALRYAADGSLDRDFGSSGRAWTRLESTSGGEAMALLPDGSVVVAGYTRSGSQPGDPALVRFTPAGALDPSFGEGGKVRFPLPGSQEGDVHLAAQGDGRLVYVAPAEGGIAVARLNPDGSLDGSFGDAGVAILSVPAGTLPRGVLVQDGVRILVLAQTGSGFRVDALNP